MSWKQLNATKRVSSQLRQTLGVVQDNDGTQ